MEFNSLNAQHEINEILKPKRRDLILNGLIWLGILITLIWTILKTFGFIHSPPWQESLPFYGFLITLVAGMYKFGQDIGDIKHSTRFIPRITQRQDTIAQGIVRLETRTGHLENDVKELKLEMKDLRTEFKDHLKQYH